MTPTRLPSLGSRGQGWVFLQIAVLILVAVACIFGGPWPEGARGLTFLVGLVVAALGALLDLAGFAGLGRSLTPMPRPLEDVELKTTGVYGLARHPLYGGLILVVLGAALTNSPIALIPAAALALVFAGKRRVEERWLLEHYAGYAAYMERVRRAFIPFVW